MPVLLQTESGARLPTANGMSTPEPAGLSMTNQEIARRVSPSRKHVWLVAAPKSGSTWLGAMLESVFGWPRVPLLDCYDRREQEIDVRTLIQHPDVDIFTPHQHTRASHPTLGIIQQFRIIPVVLVRDLFDTVISLRDHLYREHHIMPWAYFDETVYTLTQEEQINALVDLVIPWYINFYVSWFYAEKQGYCRFLWMTYQELKTDHEACVRRVLDFAGVSPSEEQIAEAVQGSPRTNTRRNVGMQGRGQTQLTDEQRHRIVQLTDYYPKVDFSRMGL